MAATPRKSEFEQVAVLSSSYGRFRWLTLERGVLPKYLAGHSLGEITALACAGSLQFEAAVELARDRGRLMDEASLEQPGAMAACRGVALADLVELCRRLSSPERPVVLANYNSPDQTVVSGESTAIQDLVDYINGSNVPAHGAKRLQVAGAFHSPLMDSVRRSLEGIISGLTLSRPRATVISSIDGRVVSEVDDIRQRLIDHVTLPVDWRAVVAKLAQLHAIATIDVGPGSVLKQLTLRNYQLSGDPTSEFMVLSLAEPRDVRRIGEAAWNHQRAVVRRYLLEAQCAPNRTSVDDYELKVIAPCRRLADLVGLVKERMLTSDELQETSDLRATVLMNKAAVLQQSGDRS